MGSAGPNSHCNLQRPQQATLDSGFSGSAFKACHVRSRASQTERAHLKVWQPLHTEAAQRGRGIPQETADCPPHLAQAQVLHSKGATVKRPSTMLLHRDSPRRQLVCLLTVGSGEPACRRCKRAMGYSAARTRAKPSMRACRLTRPAKPTSRSAVFMLIYESDRRRSSLQSGGVQHGWFVCRLGT
jgi:hypothetical protein